MSEKKIKTAMVLVGLAIYFVIMVMAAKIREYHRDTPSPRDFRPLPAGSYIRIRPLPQLAPLYPARKPEPIQPLPPVPRYWEGWEA